MLPSFHKAEKFVAESGKCAEPTAKANQDKRAEIVVFLEFGFWMRSRKCQFPEQYKPTS